MSRCGYCNSTLIVPDELRGRQARIISHLEINAGSQPRSAGPAKALWLLLLIPLAVGVFALVSSREAKRASGTKALPDAGSSSSGGGVAAHGFATVTLKFGSDGIGPGMFKDARSIAVDGAGRIYVGEYSGGRIQVFDPSGTFLTQWTVDQKMPLRALAADRKGTVYAVQRGEISRYEGDTGKPLGSVSFAAGAGFDDIVTTADGGLVTAWYSGRDDIVRFNSSGKPTRTIGAAISSTSGRAELDARVAADGRGNIYALGTFNNAVFKFTTDGSLPIGLAATAISRASFGPRPRLPLMGRAAFM